MSDLLGDTLIFLKNASQTAQNHYIERCNRVFIINVPLFFNLAWKVIAPLLSQRTRDKIKILGNKFKSELLNCISEENLPSEYGGRSGKLGTSNEEIEYKNYALKLNSHNLRLVRNFNTPGKIFECLIIKKKTSKCYYLS